MLASLDHPNIGQILGLVEAGGTRALALTLIEGPTLADQIEMGPVAIKDALTIARQIAEALEYAHERGVIHRDLKPANIKVNSEGVVKVLDFGLAKVLEDELTTAEPLANSPTLTLGHTRAGMILGTAAYTGRRSSGGSPERHFFIRRSAIRDAHGPSSLCGTRHPRCLGSGGQKRS